MRGKGITLPLATDERLALRRLAHERECSLEEAAQVALRDWLIGNGYLETEDADNDNGDEGA